MGNWHQNIVLKGVSEDELEPIIEKTITYLTDENIISSKMADNVLSEEFGYCPGENWSSVVEYPEENHFLHSRTNGLEIRKGRAVYWTNGDAFTSIECPNCKANNVDCDWGELFTLWVENPNSADLECRECATSTSISDYEFDPKWALSNLGFVFWNWPILKESFISKLELVTGKKIDKIDGKL